VEWNALRSLLRLPLRRLSVWNIDVGRSATDQDPSEAFGGRAPHLTHLYWRDLRVRDVDMERLAECPSLLVLKVPLQWMRGCGWSGDLVVTNPKTLRIESDFRMGRWQNPELSEFAS
jgi:hypothetical protein